NRPHQVSGPCDCPVENVAVVSAFLLLLNRQPNRDIARSTGSAATSSAHEQRCGGIVGIWRTHACGTDTGRHGSIVLQLLLDLVIVETVLWHQMRQVLNSLINIVTPS